MQSIPAKFIIDRMNEINLYISLQGSISSGKSTTLSSIKKYIKKNNLCALNDINSGKSTDYFLVLDEPLNEWEKEIYSVESKKYIQENTETKMVSMLGLFYKDMSKYGFLFQINAFTSRLKHIVDQISLVKNNEKNARIHIIAERSLRTDRLFFNNLYESNIISQVEWEIYNNFFNLICNEIVKKEDIMVYIHTSPEKCYKRSQKRDRKEEKDCDESTGEKRTGVCPDYLKSLHEQHENMVNNFRLEENKKVIDINFEEDMDEEKIDFVVDNLMKNIFLILQK